MQTEQLKKLTPADSPRNGNMQDTLDPTIKNLASAIKKQESGTTSDPYNAKGASGEHGAYQFMPKTWKAWAGAHLGDPNAPMTTENQNKVAYQQIKSWKDKGYNPAQIAAAWNAGEGAVAGDKWKTNVGTNSMGVKYDTPSYVKNVSKYYQDFKGSQPQGDTQSKTLTKEGIDISGLGSVTAPEQSVVAPMVDSLTKPFVTLGGGVLNAATQAVGGQPQATYSNPLGTQQDALGYRDGQELGAWDTTKQGLGAAAEGLSYAVGGPELKGALEAGKAGVFPYLTASGKAGGRMLGLASAGSSLQSGDSIPVAVGKGALGYAGGYALGGLTGLGAAALNKSAGFSSKIFTDLDNAVKAGDDVAVSKITSSPEYTRFVQANKLDDKAVDASVAKVRTAVEDGIDKSYGVAKLTRSEKAEALTDDGIKAMMEHVQNTKNPIADTKMELENKANELMDDALNPVIDKIRNEQLPLVPMERQSLLDDFNARLDKTYMTDKDKEGVRSYVEELLTKQNEGNPFGVVDAGIIRRNANFDFVNPKNKGTVSRLLGNTMRDALDLAEKKAADPQTKAIIAHINAVNKEYSRLMQGVDVIDLMARFPGQKSSELLNKAAGFFGAGATGNNPLAYLGAHKITNSMQNMMIRSKNHALFGDMSGKAGAITSSELIGNAQRILNNVGNVSKKAEMSAAPLALKSGVSPVSENHVPISVSPRTQADISRGFMGTNPLQTNLRGFAGQKELGVAAALAPLGIMGAKKLSSMGKETYQREVPATQEPFMQPTVNEITPTQHQSIVKDLAKITKSSGVKQYADAIKQAADHIGVDMDKVIRHLESENGGSWNPNLRGHADPTDRGVSQLNPVAIGIITGKTGPMIDYFKSNFGHTFDINNGNDQILAYATYINWLRTKALPEQGVKNATVDDAMIAYNTGARGIAKVKDGTATSTERARYDRYKKLLNSHGALN
jgi:hypothetical protein